jgi:hypothetical protein
MPSIKLRAEFGVHILNEAGRGKAVEIAAAFSDCLNRVEEICEKDGRDVALVRTKLQEACFFSKRAMAVLPENQE